MKGQCEKAVCHNPLCGDPILVKGRKRFYCSRCRGVFYCSPICQHFDWDVHKERCIDIDKASFFDILRTQELECPLTKHFGCHRHPKVPLNEAQQKTLGELRDMLEKLPKNDDRYRLSCQCNSLLSGQKKKDTYGISIDCKNSKVFFVFAQCNKKHCRQQDRYKPLLLLQRLRDVSDGEAYAAVPYWEYSVHYMGTPTVSLLNLTSKALATPPPEGFVRSFVHLVDPDRKGCTCEFKHIIFVSVARNPKTDEFAAFCGKTGSWKNYKFK